MHFKWNLVVAALLTTLLVFSFFKQLVAVTANPAPVEYLQPDGSSLTIFLHGDEFIHWATTTDGYTLLSNADGAYEYAILMKDGKLGFSNIQAHQIPNRNAREIAFLENIRPGLFFSPIQLEEMKQLLVFGRSPKATTMGGFPTTGDRVLLMILANFSNTSTTFSQNNFLNYMNQVNYNGSGSFKDYYLEVSYGALSVTTMVTTWVTLSQPHDYYGPSAKWGEFAHDAVVAAENQAGVNFADYDNNGDGVVDGVAIIHQGRGQEESGNPADIWSHSWSLSGAGFSPAQCTFDGVLVDAYTTMPEKNGGSMGTIGVMCHEFGHNLGAPDFYDTDYETGGQYNGTGNWDLMAGGSWNGNSGSKPAHPNAWIKHFFNWTIPQVLTGQGYITLRNAQLFPDVIRYNTTSDNEYFLCENRQLTGFDEGIPGHGLIIYHVDGNFLSSHFSSNTINATEHQGMFPVAASSPTANGVSPATFSQINTGGCPFPGFTGKNSFTDLSFPDSKSWAGSNTGKPLLEITENTVSQEITMCFMACAMPDDPVNFSASPVNYTQIDLGWNLNPDGNPVMVAFSTDGVFGIPVDGTIYTEGTSIAGGGTVIFQGTNTLFNHCGLQTGTHYYYKAFSVLTGNAYSSGVLSDAITWCQTIATLPFSEDFETNSDRPACWTEGSPHPAWQYVEGNGTGAGAGHPAYAHSGHRNACLKDGTINENKTMLISPVFNLLSYPETQLKFWLYMAKWGSKQDRLTVFYRLDSASSWVSLQEFSQPFTEWTEITLLFPEISDHFQFAFEGNARNGYGVCIDDILVQDRTAVDMEERIQDGIKVFPNPGNGIFMVELPPSDHQQGKLEVQDMNGRCLLKKDIKEEKQFSLDISDFKSGTYILKIKTDHSNHTQKLGIIRK